MKSAAAFFAAVALLNLSSARAVANDLPVRLKVAYGESYSPGSSIHVSQTILEVKVKNIAHDKDVAMRYKPASGDWQNVAVPHIGWYGNYDVFRVVGPVTNEFVVKYDVSGNTYWDNNSGTNYRIGTFRGAVGGNVMLKEARARTFDEDVLAACRHRRWFEGEVFVQNLSYHKRAGVRFTRDGGASWQDVEGSYTGKQPALGGLVDDVEIWRFKVPDEACPPHHPDPNYRFAAFYEITEPGPNFGRQFWDNNFGQDYTLPKLDGSTIR